MASSCHTSNHLQLFQRSYAAAHAVLSPMQLFSDSLRLKALIDQIDAFAPDNAARLVGIAIIELLTDLVRTTPGGRPDPRPCRRPPRHGGARIDRTQLLRLSLRAPATDCAPTITFGVSAESSLSRRRSPSPAWDNACSSSERMHASSAPRQVTLDRVIGLSAGR
jgi:hypothetical protein